LKGDKKFFVKKIKEIFIDEKNFLNGKFENFSVLSDFLFFFNQSEIIDQGRTEMLKAGGASYSKSQQIFRSRGRRVPRAPLGTPLLLIVNNT